MYESCFLFDSIEKENFRKKINYGQQDFDFDAGIIHFMSPVQVQSFE